MLTCCNSSTFHWIQLFADMRKCHLKLFDLFNIANYNINSSFKLKTEDLIDVWNWFLCCKNEIQVLSQVFLDTHIVCSYSRGYRIEYRKKSEKPPPPPPPPATSTDTSAGTDTGTGTGTGTGNDTRTGTDTSTATATVTVTGTGIDTFVAIGNASDLRAAAIKSI